MSHEVSRLDKQCMADAFERLLPMVERQLHRRPQERGSPHEITSRAADNPEEGMGMTALNVAIYARVSSEQQASDNTIASQIEALETRLAQDGLTLTPDERYTDEGYSGATLVRPALERLRDAVAAGSLDRLYVHSPDRLARRYAYQVLLIEEIRRAGVEIVFLNRPIGLSPEDDLLLQVQGMVAEYERAKILERSRRGKRHAARQGTVSVFSGAPYGYRYIGKRDGGGVARYEILEDEAQIVRRVFHWIGRERVSIGETCRRLQQEGCPDPQRQDGLGSDDRVGHPQEPRLCRHGGLRQDADRTMPARLRPVRGGSEQPRRAHGVYNVAPSEWIGVPVPPLVDEALFEAVREQLEQNRRRNRQHARGQRYLLQGLIVCQQCGYAYYGKAISLSSARASGATTPTIAAAAATPTVLVGSAYARTRRCARIDWMKRCGGRSSESCRIQA